MPYTRRETFLPFTRPMIGQDGAPSAIASRRRSGSGSTVQWTVRSGGSQGLARTKGVQ